MALAAAQETSALSLVTNADLHWSRFDASELCFVSQASVPVRIVDVPRSAPSELALPSCEALNAQALAAYFGNAANSDFQCRLISICQQNSWAQLQATKKMVREIVDAHGVNSEFLQVLLSFSYRSTDEEQGYTVPWTMTESETTFEIFYTFRYPEFKGNKSEPWVLRQTGVYQRFDIEKKTSLWILVNPMPDSVAARRVTATLNAHQTELSQNPLLIHSVIHSSYFGYWRDYLAAYEKILLPIADTTTATFITETLRVNHETLGKVRFLESRFLPMNAILDNFVDILDELKDLSKTLEAAQALTSSGSKTMIRQLENHRKQSMAYSRTARFLQQRSNNTATLLADTLAFKNQVVAQEQNISILRLTRSAVFLTLLTLFYLPWTFVAGLFGMNFFVYDQKTSRLLTSPMIWIYVVTSLALTVTTMLVYYCVAGRHGQAVKQAPIANAASMNLHRGYTGLTEKSRPSKV